jgi:8-amino-7-oxononanoate synthase
MTVWTDRIRYANESIQRAGRWREIRTLEGTGPEFVLSDGRHVVSFASNDYLGLSHHPVVRAAAAQAVQTMGTGSGASRLVVGGRVVHRLLEQALAEWKGAESALLFPTGYATNVGVLSAFGGKDVVVLSDELNHASIVDGCRLSRAEVTIYPHGDSDFVAKALASARGRPIIVITDAVFSMDGDVAPLNALATAALEHEALLVVDEAHSVLGPSWSPPAGLQLMRVGTLSKTLGSLGGFVAGPSTHREHLINSARPFIFSTATTPPDAAAALAALHVLRSAEGAALLERLATLVDRVAPGHSSPILPIVVGDERSAAQVSSRLLDEYGLLVPAIRPPTVPPGTSRLRIALSAEHTDDQVEVLRAALTACELAPKAR